MPIKYLTVPAQRELYDDDLMMGIQNHSHEPRFVKLYDKKEWEKEVDMEKEKRLTPEMLDMFTQEKNNRAFVEAICQKQHEIYSVNHANGWWEHERQLDALVGLMHSELSEALEAYRDDAQSTKIPGFTGVEEELADTIIRILDYAGRYNLRIGEAINEKIQYNRGRGFRHGNKRC